MVFWKAFFKSLLVMIIFELIFKINWGFSVYKPECNVVILSLMFRDFKWSFFNNDWREGFSGEWMIEGFAHVDIEEFFHDVNILVFNKSLFLKSLFDSCLLYFWFEGFVCLMFGYGKFGVNEFIVMDLLFSE